MFVTLQLMPSSGNFEEQRIIYFFSQSPSQDYVAAWIQMIQTVIQITPKI